MRYFVKTPWWLKKIYPSYTWHIGTDERVVYLTFDDGPHERATPFVLDCLREYGAEASFFCIGKNVEIHPGLYQRILEEGHVTGNHTYGHLNGWKTGDEMYIQDIDRAGKYIDSSLFRPPYGRIKRTQAKKVMEGDRRSVIMWDVLSGDFDTTVSGDQCVANVVNNTKEGSIVVFHDSEKAFPLLEYSLPRVMKKLSAKGFVFKALPRQVKK